MGMEEKITIRGASEHNLKQVNLELPRNRLIVFTGVSGSGKSSLAFDTLYAEGQRRYVESLSAYARQFLGQMEKPKVDYIGGLSPAISIEQKTVSRNPRSTVGTITEIHDYLRVLYARIGRQHCPECDRPVSAQTVEQMVDRILKLPEGTRLLVLAPKVRQRKGEYKSLLEEARKEGFVRVRINGEVHDLDEKITLDKKMKHNIEIVVDRLIIRGNIRSRLADSVETALRQSEGNLICSIVDGEDIFFSENTACQQCGISFEPLSPQMFSFNSPLGRCEACDGLGRRMEYDPSLLVPDPGLSINEGALHPWRKYFSGETDTRFSRKVRKQMEELAKKHRFTLDQPWESIPEKVRNVILFGKNNKSKKSPWTPPRFQGLTERLEKLWTTSSSEPMRQWILDTYMHRVPCPACDGSRLRPQSRAVKVSDQTLEGLCALSLGECMAFFENLHLEGQEKEIAQEVLREIIGRLQFLLNVGLHYLSLDRAAPTLSGGEAQRIRLASQIGCGLVGVLYILDEPSIGLHPRDNRKLIDNLVRLRDQGNTVLVVEHDEETIRSADWIVDFGPGAGKTGGGIIAEGPPAEIEKSKDSATGDFLAGRRSIPIPGKRRKASRETVEVIGARENNLKSIDIRFPLGCLIGVTGVSGSGKSTLVNEILHKALARKLHRAKSEPGRHEEIKGMEHLDKVIAIDQSPIGRTPRSNPATYCKAFDPIRDLFSRLPEAKMRGYKPGRFSFNVKGGRCEACRGDGMRRIEMHFLPDVFVTCDVCKGKRFNRETLQVKFKGRSIADVLQLTVAEALELFKNIPRLKRILGTLADVGLDYIHLGQAANTLSGGEAQRVKLARELGKVATGRTLYILDEPTTGLHPADIEKLLRVLDSLVQRGNTVVVIEHHIDVIKSADHLIDLGPEGGEGGGRLVAEGSPEEVAKNQKSHTGKYLKMSLAKTSSAGQNKR
jgi:excinuclease ABC subunit A